MNPPYRHDICQNPLVRYPEEWSEEMETSLFISPRLCKSVPVFEEADAVTVVEPTKERSLWQRIMSVIRWPLTVLSSR